MNKELIDDVFYCEEHVWGTCSSYDKEGKCIITSLNKEICIDATRWYLKKIADGGFDEAISYSGKVDGKL